MGCTYSCICYRDILRRDLAYLGGFSPESKWASIYNHGLVHRDTVDIAYVSFVVSLRDTIGCVVKVICSEYVHYRI